MALTMNEIYEEILKEGGMTPSKKVRQTASRFPDKVAMRYKEYGVWQETTYEEFWKKSNYLSMALKFFQIEKGNSVAIHSENRPEWFIADIGIQSLGAVSVGLYPTNHSGSVDACWSDTPMGRRTAPFHCSHPGVSPHGVVVGGRASPSPMQWATAALLERARRHVPGHRIADFF